MIYKRQQFALKAIQACDSNILKSFRRSLKQSTAITSTPKNARNVAKQPTLK